jgi:3-oxoacyl-[acyl-carrier protein] reductase
MRTAVVTGGGTGIGRAVARRLAADGDDVVVVGRRREVLEEAAGGAMRVEVADLRDPAEVAALADRLGAVDVLVLNAGGSLEARDASLEATAEVWTEEFRLIVLSTVLARL